MKRRVHIFAIIRVPIDVEDSTSPEDAIEKAETMVDGWGGLPYRSDEAEDAGGRDGYVVDVLTDKGRYEEEGSFKGDGTTRNC